MNQGQEKQATEPVLTQEEHLNFRSEKYAQLNKKIKNQIFIEIQQNYN
jgi:hypothetical protein